ncbi:MAG: Crp/Fnr family transcriptional regulator [Chloroflexi bacterium]|nr:Crp/Fnr family transcriptional regulator [Chloroflexota bacterium]MCL5074125.1 Crp/Fnr family transcriptional regulator [Chloroflexota bacterium]
MEFLGEFPYFADLSPAEISQIKGFFRERTFEQDELIFLEDEPCHALYFVKSGRVKIFKTSPEGKEQVLRIMGRGDSFNDVPIFDDGPNPASAQALEKTTVYLISKEDIRQILRTYPAVTLATLKVFAKRLRYLTLLVEDLSFRHVVSRLAKLLLQYAEQPEQKIEKGVRYRLTQQEMAAMVGTAREMISRALRRLEEEGAIKVERNRIVIQNAQFLRNII